MEITTTRGIAASLAAHIARTDWIPDGVKKPRVFLDAITTQIDLKDHPGIIVVPRNSTGLHRGTPEHQIEVVMCLDATALSSNAAALAETPDGVEVYGSGALLDALVAALLNTIKAANPGSILSDMQVEFALDNLPMQYATMTLTYRDNPAF